MSGVLVSFAVHYTTFLLSLAVITCDHNYMDLPTHHIYTGRFKYLTYWSFLCGLLYNNLAALLDALVWARGRDNQLWRSIRDFAFTTIVFPAALSVCILFWSLYTANPRFMRSPEEEKLIPWWMNHGYHTLPIVAALAQTCLISHEYPSRKMAFAALATLDTLYIAWLFWIHYKADHWVYPFLAKLSLPGVVAVVVASATFSMVLYLFGKKLNDFVWGNTKQKTS